MSSPPPEDEWITLDVLHQEALATGISIHDILKRRVWLAGGGEWLNFTLELEQAGCLNHEKTKAKQRRRRVQREHLLLYSMRIFAKDDDDWDVGWWLPQHVTLKEHHRFPLQGCKLADDAESWQAWSALRNGPPELTVAPMPPLLPITSSRTPMTPAEAPGEARFSDPASSSSGALPKSRANPLFIMRATSKARPPVNPIVDRASVDDAGAISSTSLRTSEFSDDEAPRPVRRSRSRSRTPILRARRSARVAAQPAASSWETPQDGPRSRSRSPRRQRSQMWFADARWTGHRWSRYLSPTPSN